MVEGTDGPLLTNLIYLNFTTEEIGIVEIEMVVIIESGTESIVENVVADVDDIFAPEDGNISLGLWERK